MMNKYIKTNDITIKLAHMGYKMKDGDEMYDILVKYSHGMLWHIKENIVMWIERMVER